MNKQRKVSIIIPNYNGIKYIKMCIDSLLAQSFNDFEIIIVDNGSDDGSSEFIIKTYPMIKLIYLKENMGFSRAVNEGIKSSDSEFVVLLNNDVEVEKGWIESLLDLIKNDEKIFSVSIDLFSLQNLFPSFSQECVFI